jgi:hypothetical protein
LIGNTFDQSGHDIIKFNTPASAGATGMLVEYSCSAARYVNPGAAHSDHFQALYPTTNGTVRYCLFLMRDSFQQDTYEGNQGWWFGDSATGSSGWAWTQNLFAINNGAVKGFISTTASVTYNALYAIIPVNSKGAGTHTFDGQTLDYNVLTSSSQHSAEVGPNGLFKTLSSTDDGSSYTDIITGAMSKTMTAVNIKPIVGQRTHWNYGGGSGKVGPWDLMRLCFDATAHNNWMDWGWPVRPLCHVTIDTNYEFASTYGTSTTYDANGRSV